MFRRPSEQPDGGLSIEEMEIEQQILKVRISSGYAWLECSCYFKFKLNLFISIYCCLRRTCFLCNDNFSLVVLAHYVCRNNARNT